MLYFNLILYYNFYFTHHRNNKHGFTIMRLTKNRQHYNISVIIFTINNSHKLFILNKLFIQIDETLSIRSIYFYQP
jgi:hypothetical protein